jgi:hypothetical protein
VALFVKFDYKIKGPARLVAYSEWTLSNVEQDKLISNHVYNGVQNQHDIMLFHFERPDFVRFSLNTELHQGDLVREGDIIAHFMSSNDALHLAELTGLLKQAKANLAALETGEKQAFQQEASEALAYAKAELQAYEPVLKRQIELHEKNLISDQDLEIAQAQYDLYKINVSVQEARLQSVKTGEKEEAISIIEAQAKSISDQLAIFQEKIDAASIKSPIHGIIVQPDHALAELCHICELDSMVVQMPVKLSELKNVKIGDPMTINVPGSDIINVKVSNINQSATFINLKPMYLVSTVVPNPNYRIKHGMTGNVEIKTGKSTLFDIIAESWTSFRFNK